MARELYNWDQVRSYAIIALCNLESKNIEKSVTNYIRELDTLQTVIGKDGSIGYANRLLHKYKIKYVLNEGVMIFTSLFIWYKIEILKYIAFKEAVMNSEFKINVYFQEKGEEIEKIIALYLMNVLDKREMKTKYSI